MKVGLKLSHLTVTYFNEVQMSSSHYTKLWIDRKTSYNNLSVKMSR